MSVFRVAICALALLSASGCAELPLKEGGLEVGKNTTASLDELAVARITNSF